MDSITDFYNYEPAIALLYFLVFLIPFAGGMFYLIRQNNRWKKHYDKIYGRLWAIADQAEVELLLNSKEQLGKIITNEEIKALEQDLNTVEEKIGLEKQAVVSYKYAPKPKKMHWLEKRVDKLEHVMLQEEASFS